ncbi:unnamed protein product [Acanthoscelides obtectus]|uniref:C2 domain-containing protein n=1 Tax=Acanthoscelides obtectus TaxID=200917 RepID=A0A9P0JP24_ACAOB|nr:unnamed protein product [Acanthoscelides obtectus]CAK1641325.1 Otoferlin [Acanthoscelides obtectus]
MKKKWVKMLEKKKTYLVTIAVLEGRHYTILNMDSAVVVRIGDQKKTTNVKSKSDCPFYNEYFVFEFQTTHDKMMDTQINICVIRPRTVWRKTKILGCITLDVATVFCQKNHQFYHKWGILQSPKHDPLTGPRGYLKLDITVLTKGDTPTIPRHVDNDEIEGNLLLADGMFMERQKALYMFDVYKCMHLVGHPSVHISSNDEEKKRHPNVYVEVTFAGQTVRTSSLGGTANPEFNERLIIVDLFPPLCQRIKVDICYEDHIAIMKAHHFTKYISLKSISNGSKDGFLPTFGPSLIHLYSTHPMEGYTATLMMAIKTDLQQHQITPEAKESTMVESIPGLDEVLEH